MESQLCVPDPGTRAQHGSPQSGTWAAVWTEGLPSRHHAGVVHPFNLVTPQEIGGPGQRTASAGRGAPRPSLEGRGVFNQGSQGTQVPPLTWRPLRQGI